MAFLDFLGPLGSIASGAISGISSLVSGNKQAEAQREANKLNYKMFQEQLGFTEDMWNKQNAYNTPVAQRQRYEQAGINPYFALGNISGGNAESVSTPAAQAALPVDAYGKAIGQAGQSIGSAVGSAVGAYQSQLMMNEQIVGQQEANRSMMIKNRFAVAHENNQIQKEWYELSNLVKSGKLTDEQVSETHQRMRKLERESSLLDIEQKYYSDYLSSRNRQMREQANIAYNNAREAALKAAYQKLVNDAFPKLTDAQLSVFAAQAASAFASADLSKKQSEHEVIKTEREKIQKIGDILDNGIKSNTYTLQDLDLTKQDIELMRLGKIKELQENHNTWLKIRSLVDDSNWMVPSLFRIGK